MLPRYLDEIVPRSPGLDRGLLRRLSLDTRDRIDRTLRAARALPGKRRAERLRAIRRWLLRLPDPALADGGIRTRIASIEDAVRVAAEAERVLRGTRRSPSRLVGLVLDLGVLAEVAPSGSLPSGFARRARVVALREIDRALESVVLPRTGAGIVVAPVLEVTGGRAVPGGRDPGFERRVPGALALLERAWPEAHRLVTTRTHRVVPVAERGVVSFSSAREPGVTYVNVRSRPLVRLAEDLLHEATHQRIHQIEALMPLAAVGDGPGDPRIYSPWRREERPVRGLLHGACTFVAGATYFARLLPAARDLGLPPSRRAWVRRRLYEEVRNVGDVLRALSGARRRGLVTAAGERVLRAVARDLARLRR